MSLDEQTCRPFKRPDYAGRGIANLMASIELATGADRAGVRLPACSLLDGAVLEEARHVVLLVLDGLGSLQLRSHVPDGALAAARLGDLTSVFPSTTASAVSTYMTGDVPLAHGLTGWHMWFSEVGGVAAPLPFKLRGAQTDLAALGFEAAKLFGTRAFAARSARRVTIVHPVELCNTHYTSAHRGAASVQPFASLDALCERIVAAGIEPEPSYVYAYWPMLDSLSHGYGWASAEAFEHLRNLDRAIEDCARRLRGTGTVLLVCADHGFIDTDVGSRLRLEDYPQLAATLERPLCGEPRLAYCYVRPGAEGEFEQIVSEQLGHAAQVRSCAQVLDDGLLGPGPEHRQIRERLGTHAMLMQGNYCLTDRIDAEPPFTLVGVHGGMSDAELRVPLCVFQG